MGKISAKRVMNGTFGELWFEGKLVSSVYKVAAKESFTREKVPMAGSLRAGKKLTEIEGTGSIGMHKVDSTMIRMIDDKVRAGYDPEFTLVSKLDDPDAYGAERVALTGVQFDDLTLADWEVGVLGKIEAPFTFTGHEFLDLVREA